jgi:hypothetical protein
MLTTVSLALYLGLAIVGMGGPNRFFRTTPLIALTVISAALGVASVFTEGHLGFGTREDRSNRRVIGALASSASPTPVCLPIRTGTTF